MPAPDAFAGWAILELMGHRRLGGHVTETTIAGAGFFRIDVPASEGGNVATQYYRPDSVYCLTPATEETARAVARMAQPAPVQRWELPALNPPAGTHYPADDDPEPVDDDEEQF